MNLLDYRNIPFYIICCIGLYSLLNSYFDLSKFVPVDVEKEPKTSTDAVHQSEVDNELIIFNEFTVSYNRSNNLASWVTWTVQRSNFGKAERQNDFREWGNLNVVPSDYKRSGFDRGHLCPSADWTNSVKSNSTTFLMCNMIPQSPKLNRGIWGELEKFVRTKVKKGKKAFIVAGVDGIGGIGSRGKKRRLNGKVVVPSSLWKAVLFVDVRNNLVDIKPSNCQAMAVIIPNRMNLRSDWKNYITSINEVEKRVGLNLFMPIDDKYEEQVESMIFK